MQDNGSSANTRFVRRAVILSLFFALAATAGIWLFVQARPSLTCAAARDAAFARSYARAQEHLTWLEANSETDYYRALLECASIADYNGDYDTALEWLSLTAPADSEAYDAFAASAEELSAACIYHKALRLYEQGDYLQAMRTASDARSYEPAASLQQMAQSAYQASLPTPVPAPTPAPTAVPTTAPTPVPSPTAVQETAAPETPSPVPTSTHVSRPALLPEGRIAVGAAHTVVLREDGTVTAFGDNTYGQTDVSSWQSVVYVAAGAYHTLGLTADGRVLACGDNTHMQCDVSFYGGVKAIAASDYDTVLLLADGSVISTGYHEYVFLQDVTGAERIWAGSYGVLVKTPSGIHASHAGLALNSACETAALSRGYAIGADEQGRVFSTMPQIPAWTDIARVSAGENAVLALTSDGQVLSHVFDSHSLCGFTFYQPVLALSAGANHYAFLLADGTLEIRYANGRIETHVY